MELSEKAKLALRRLNRGGRVDWYGIDDLSRSDSLTIDTQAKNELLRHGLIRLECRLFITPAGREAPEEQDG